MSCAVASPNYPADWWKPFPKEQAESWEILPQDAKENEVILSKRTELGIFSNLTASPLTFDGEKYASVEAFWQMMKYPDLTDKEDIRTDFSKEYPFTRDEVKDLAGFDCKKAGDAANKVMKEHKINWISYKNHKFNYKDMGVGSDFHYNLIYKVIEAKVMQNQSIKKLLLQTGDLKLRPDHTQAAGSPKAYYYFDILMEIRSKLQAEAE